MKLIVFTTFVGHLKFPPLWVLHSWPLCNFLLGRFFLLIHKWLSLNRYWLFATHDCSPPGSSVHEISQARILEWVAISFSRGSSQPRDQTWVSCIAGRFFTVWATREALCYIPLTISCLLRLLLSSRRSILCGSDILCPFDRHPMCFWSQIPLLAKANDERWIFETSNLSNRTHIFVKIFFLILFF